MSEQTNGDAERPAVRAGSAVYLVALYSLMLVKATVLVGRVGSDREAAPHRPAVRQEHDALRRSIGAKLDAQPTSGLGLDGERAVPRADPADPVGLAD